MAFYGGHRGYGCTDHPAYSEDGVTPDKPTENSLDSISKAFEAGADFVEIDAVLSADGEVFVCHSVNPDDHFFGSEKPNDFLNRLQYSSFKDIPVGRHNPSRLALLGEVLSIISKTSLSNRCDYSVNIELKGVQDTNQDCDSEELCSSVFSAINKSGFPKSQILFSSFALRNLTEMSKLMKDSNFAFLFQEATEIYSPYSGDSTSKDICYLPFTEENIQYVCDQFNERSPAGAMISHLHPEIRTITASGIRMASNLGLSVNSWTYLEKRDQEFLDLHLRAQNTCSEFGVPFGMISDYLDLYVDKF